LKSKSNNLGLFKFVILKVKYYLCEDKPILIAPKRIPL